MKFRGKRFLIGVVSVLLAVLACSLVIGCKKPGGGSGDAPSYMDKTLVADFETYQELQSFEYGRTLGAVSVNTDERFITAGSGSMKICKVRSVCTVKIPVKSAIRGTNFSDLTKVSALLLDVYNDTDADYTLSLFIQFDVMASEVKTFTLAPKQWTNIRWDIDAGIMALANNLDKTASVAVTFGLNTTEQGVYLDRLKFEFTEEIAKRYEMTLDENEICSFDKDYQKYITISTGYANCENIAPVTEINTDAQYVHDGDKSLRAAFPSGDGSYPYFTFSKKLIHSIDFSKYSGTACLSFWVFNAQDKKPYLMVDLMRRSVTQKRQFGYSLKPGWNEINIPFAEINKVDAGVDVLTEDLDEIRLVFGKHSDGTDRVYYFDSFKISDIKDSVIMPLENELYPLGNESVRNRYNEDLSAHFSAGSGATVTISDEYATTEGGYSLKVSGLNAGGAINSWATVTFSDILSLVTVLSEQPEYKAYKHISFKMRVPVGSALFNKDYNTFGQAQPSIAVNDAAGWVEIFCPVEAMANKTVAFYCGASATDIYFDDFKLIPSYTVTWRNDDNSLLTRTLVAEGDIPRYPAATPEKEIGGTVYIFGGWSPGLTAATADATYTATFVERYVPNSNVLYDFEQASLQELMSADITDYIAIGLGGSGSLSCDAVDDNAGYKVKFDGISGGWYRTVEIKGLRDMIAGIKALGSYDDYGHLSIRFYSENNVIIGGNITGDSNGDPVFGNPNYPQQRIAGGSWGEFTIPVEDIKNDVFYVYVSKAFYIDDIKLVRSHTVTWQNIDGKGGQTTSLVSDGTLPVYPGSTPEKEADGTTVYTFGGWTPELTAATGDATYTATFVEKYVPNSNVLYDFEQTSLQALMSADITDYIVIGLGGSGALSNETVGDNTGYKVKFDGIGGGWYRTVEIKGLRKMIEGIKALGGYDDYRHLSIRFYSANNVIIGGTLGNGHTSVFGNQDMAQQRIAGGSWGEFVFPIADIKDDVFHVWVSATFYIDDIKMVRSHTVTWQNIDGEGGQVTSLVADGTLPVYPGATPEKEADGTTVYTFGGWSPGLTAATGNATYTATFVEKYVPNSNVLYDFEQSSLQGLMSANITDYIAIGLGGSGSLSNETVGDNTGYKVKFDGIGGGWYRTVEIKGLRDMIAGIKALGGYDDYGYLSIRFYSENNVIVGGTMGNNGTSNVFGNQDMEQYRIAGGSWGEFLFPIADIKDDVFHVWVSATFYMDDIKLVNEYAIDITESFAFTQRTGGGGIYLNYANNPNIFGSAYQSTANTYAYITKCVDISAFAGKKLRIMLPNSASFGLAFSTVDDIWNKETKQDGWYFINNDAAAPNGKVVEIEIPVGAKYVKTTDYLATYRQAHPEVLDFSAVIVD